MGVQVSTMKTGKHALEPKKKNSKARKVKIGILAFEVASVMSKSVQLWHSLSEPEMQRLKSEIIKTEGILSFVSNDESALLWLACLEKLQDLTAVAMAVARLGKRCCEPALAGFEHIYTDILKQSIDVQDLEIPVKEMEAKVKKMERYMVSTSNLYQELEILSEMEQALRRVKVEADPTQKDNFFALEQKASWQRQEIKYLKSISLWNRTYDKIVSLLARTACTIYGRIIRVFGFPSNGWPQGWSLPTNGECHYVSSLIGCESAEHLKLNSFQLSQDYDTFVAHPVDVNDATPSLSYESLSTALPASNGAAHGLGGQEVSNRDYINNEMSNGINGLPNSNSIPSAETYLPSYFCFSPGRRFSHQRSGSDESPASSSAGTSDVSGFLIPSSGPIPQMTRRYINMIFDPKCSLQKAPPSTLGGAALALHYANLIVVVERMVRYPDLICQDARDDLYQMLPKRVRVCLRARLRSCMRGYSSPECNGAHVTDWKEALEKLLGWLAPLAHNMLRWQSERNLEQQVIPRMNVLLLQTLYFADQVKAEAAIADLLVGLNYLWRYERDSNANSFMECASNKELDDYLEWQLSG